MCISTFVADFFLFTLFRGSAIAFCDEYLYILFVLKLYCAFVFDRIVRQRCFLYIYAVSLTYNVAVALIGSVLKIDFIPKFSLIRELILIPSTIQSISNACQIKYIDTIYVAANLFLLFFSC